MKYCKLVFGSDVFVLVLFAGFELTLAEGNRLEKRLFHATFATVSTRAHRRASEELN